MGTDSTTPKVANIDDIDAKICQDRLVKLWGGGLVLAILIITGQLATPMFSGKESSIVGWCSQTFAPLLGTMIGKWTGESNTGKRVVRRSIYKFTFWVSMIYLVLAIGLLLQIGSLKMKDNPDDTGNPIHATTADALEQHKNYRIAVLEARSLLLGVLMIPLGASITACFRGRNAR